MSFAALIDGARSLEGGLALAVPETWHQGRTAYGGFSAALALAAARKVGGDTLPALRSATVNFVGPLYGEVEARARLLRQGKNATWIGAEILREGEVALTACFVFMRPVESALTLDLRPAPEGLIAPEEAAAFAMRHSPNFLREHFEVRFALPRGEEKLPDICWWVRLKDRAGLDPMLELLLLADALPPGVLPLLPAKTPVSSMTWHANLLTAAPETRDGWWLMRDTGDYAVNGCSSQQMAIWNAEGMPVVSGMQAIALFG